MKTWTIIGAGYGTPDIIDTILKLGDKPLQLVLNQDLDLGILEHIPVDVKRVKLADFKPGTDNYIFGFGDPNKEKLLKQLAGFKLNYANLIHPFSAIACDFKLGKGNYIAAGVVIASGNGLMGDFNQVNRNASLGHNLKMGDYNQVNPSATITGLCTIGSKNIFGAGSTVIDRIAIGDGIVLGAGAVAVDDLVNPGIYIGVPAKLLQKNAN